MSRPIDADALIKELKSERFPGAPYVGVGLKIAIEKICEAPTIEPERKKGTWIPFDIPWYRCSECGAERENTVFMEYFCPNCGADMRGGDSNE